MHVRPKTVYRLIQSSGVTTKTNNPVRPEIQSLSAYHVADAAGMIKLDAMENPYAWPACLPESLQQQWLEVLRRAQLNRYPDPRAGDLSAMIREVFAVPDGHGVVLGNGSDELIHLLITAVAGPGAVVLSVTPGFVMYPMIALYNRVEYVGVPLNAEDFSLDMTAMRQAIARHRPPLIFLAYPNNPTGNLFAQQQVEEIIDSAPGWVVIDEAYAAFAADSFLPRLVKFPNLLVMRTLSKMGLAGLRLGYLCAAPQLTAELDKIRLPYNINTLTQLSAEFALRHKAVLDRQAAELCAQRRQLLHGLQSLPGLQVFPSQANFILFRTGPGEADRVFTALKQAGVLIKNLSAADGLEDCLRVTVGLAEENARFLAALEEALC